MPTRVAILGGGAGGLAAAFELTATPALREQYEVTVYTQGWRLGGKGAGPPGTRQISSEWQKPGHLQEAAGRTGKAPPLAIRTWSATASSAVSSFSRAFSLSTMALVFGS
jgi:glycine/D-amino acid oxidase-like deaminating enzyme